MKQKKTYISPQCTLHVLESASTLCQVSKAPFDGRSDDFAAPQVRQSSWDEYES